MYKGYWYDVLYLAKKNAHTTLTDFMMGTLGLLVKLSILVVLTPFYIVDTFFYTVFIVFLWNPFFSYTDYTDRINELCSNLDDLFSYTLYTITLYSILSFTITKYLLLFTLGLYMIEKALLTYTSGGPQTSLLYEILSIILTIAHELIFQLLFSCLYVICRLLPIIYPSAYATFLYPLLLQYIVYAAILTSIMRYLYTTFHIEPAIFDLINVFYRCLQSIGYTFKNLSTQCRHAMKRISPTPTEAQTTEYPNHKTIKITAPQLMVDTDTKTMLAYSEKVGNHTPLHTMIIGRHEVFKEYLDNIFEIGQEEIFFSAHLHQSSAHGGFLSGGGNIKDSPILLAIKYITEYSTQRKAHDYIWKNLLYLKFRFDEMYKSDEIFENKNNLFDLWLSPSIMGELYYVSQEAENPLAVRLSCHGISFEEANRLANILKDIDHTHQFSAGEFIIHILKDGEQPTNFLAQFDDEIIFT